MRRSVLLLAATSLLGTAACFEPDFGPGGFACQQGQCPEGYACVDEGGQPVCRPADRPLDLGPAADRGPSRDLPLPRDGSPGDTSPPDVPGPRPDGPPVPDLAVPADLTGPPPDLPAPPPDSVVPPPDTVVTPDTVPPVPCSYDVVLTKELPTGTGQAFDLILDTDGAPHLVYVDKYDTPFHVYPTANPATDGWISVKGPMSADKVAIAMETKTLGKPMFHVLLRELPGRSATTLGVHRSHFAPRATSWSKPQAITPSGTLVQHMDIAGQGATLRVVTSGNHSLLGSIVNKYSLVWDSVAMGYVIKSAGDVQSGPYGHIRAAASSKSWVYAVWAKGTNAAHWSIERDGIGWTRKLSAELTSAPAAAAIGGLTGYHFAFVVKGTPGALMYAQWDGSQVSKFNSTTLVSSATVDPASPDVTTGPQGAPYVSCSEPSSSQVRYFYSDGAGGWKGGTLPTTGKPDATRIAVTSHGLIHISYRVGPELHHACRIP